METSASLSRIQTCWTDLFKAHGGPGESGADVLHRLVLRYYGAVSRYLCRVLRAPTAAEALSQEFAARFLRGDFRRADPTKGSFRVFLRTALRNLARDYWDRQGRQKKR